MCQKDFLPLHFAVGQVLSVSEYDLENRRILCKQKYCIRNIVLKVLIHSETLPHPIKRGGGEGWYDLPKIESLRGVQNVLLERGDKPEKGGLM